jgi:hypothetical protein
MRSLASWCVALALVAATAVLAADDHSVIYDEDIDFSIFKTFTMRPVRVTSARPELRFPAVAKSISDSMRDNLIALGLKESDGAADLIVDCQITGTDFNIGPFGRANQVPTVARGRGRSEPLPGPVDFTEITMVLDLLQAGSSALVFRGVYHDDEKDMEKLAKRLPKDATTLLSQYPRKKKEPAQ